MVELTLPLMEQLQKRLDKFTDATLTGTVGIQTGYLKSVIEKVDAIVAEAPLSLGNKSSIMPNKSIHVNLSQSSYLPTDSFLEISRLLLKQMGNLVTQWRGQSKGEEENRNLPTDLSTSFVELTQALVHQFPDLGTRLYSSVLAIFSQKETENVNISSPGLPLMCLSLVNLGYTLSLTTEAEEQCETKSFMETVVDCLDIINNSENVLRFCLGYAEMACNWLTTLTEQLAQQDVVELGSICVTEEDLLPPAFVQKVNFVCQRRGLIKSDGSASFCLQEKKLVIQTHKLYRKSQWQQMCKKHQVSLVKWIEMEWSVTVPLDPLSSSLRSSYLLKTSGLYLQVAQNLLTFSKTVLLALARLCNCQSNCGSRDKDLKLDGFLQILRGLLENSKECNEKESSLLLQVLHCSGEYTDQIIRFVLQLPSHLLFCDSLHQDFESKHVATALDIIGYFVRSSQNEGAYLSLEATTYIFKGLEVLQSAHPSKASSALSSILMDPIVFISFLVHSHEMTDINMLDTIKTISSPWHSKVMAVKKWVQSLTESESPGLTNDQDMLCLEDWQKSGALFSFLLCRKNSIDLRKLRLQENVQLHLLQMLAANLTLHGTTEEDKNVLERSFIELLSKDHALLMNLLSSDCKLRSQLGIQDQTELVQQYDFVILRLSKEIPANVMIQNRRHNVIAPVVAAYRRILTYAQDAGTNCPWNSQFDLSCWIKSLVDFSSPKHLDSIPELPISLENQDVLLFKYIQEIKRQKR